MTALVQRSYPATARIDAMRNGGLHDGWQLNGAAGRARESRRPSGCFRNNH